MTDIAALVSLATSSNESDPLRNEARDLISLMLKRTRYLLEEGTPQVQTTLLRSVVPTLLRALKEEQKVSDEIERMRETQMQLMALVRASLQGGGDIAHVSIKGENDVAEDEPQELSKGATVALDGVGDTIPGGINAGVDSGDHRGSPIRPPDVLRVPASRRIESKGK